VSNLPQHPSRLCASVLVGFELDGDNVNCVIICVNLCTRHPLIMLLTKESYPHKPSKAMGHRHLIKRFTDAEFHSSYRQWGVTFCCSNHQCSGTVHQLFTQITVPALVDTVHLIILLKACCLGVSPNHTTSSLGLLKAWLLSMAAKKAEALIMPLSGILSNIWPISLLSANSLNCCSIPFTRVSIFCTLLAYPSSYLAA
jgi:hypothetical protein